MSGQLERATIIITVGMPERWEGPLSRPGQVDIFEAHRDTGMCDICSICIHDDARLCG